MKAIHLFHRLLPAYALLALIQGCSSGGGGSNAGASTSGTSSTSSSSTSSSSGTGNNSYSKLSLVIDLADQLTGAYTDLNTQVIALKAQSNSFCSDSSDTENFSALQTSWHKTTLSWQYVQGINFGPITDDSRIFRVSFYPVRQQQMQDRISELIDATETITTAVIQGKAASLQGLPALEYVLFRNDALTLINDNASKYCEFITSVTDNLSSMAAPVASAWASNGSYRITFTAPENTQQSLNDWIEAINLHVTIAQQKLASGNESDIESPFAQTSMLNVRENIQFLHDAFFMGENNGIQVLLNNLEASTAAAELGNRLTIAQASLSAANDSIVVLNSTDAGRLELDRLVDEVHNVQEDFAIEVAQALNVTIIFNGADGD